MQVFKLYFKLLKKSLPSILIYLGIFLGVIIYSTMNSSSNKNTAFSGNKVDVAFINEDENTALIDGFQSYLSEYCNFKEIPDTQIGIKDALFFRKVIYVIRIPKGFTESFMSGKNMKIEKFNVPNTAESISVDIAIERFFHTAQIYQKHVSNMEQQKLVTLVQDNLVMKADVTLFSQNTIEDHKTLITYFNYLCYGLVSMLVLGVGMIMVSVQKIDLKRRNLVAPMSTVNMNIQLILGNFVFTLVCLGILIAGGVIITPDFKLDKTSIYLIFNAAVFSVSILSISFLAGITVKGKNAASAVATLLSLGLAFISGAFVPQEYLGDSILKIAAFTPSYWYVKANNVIGAMTEFSTRNLEDVHRAMLIELGFAAAIFAISLVVSKKKSQELY